MKRALLILAIFSFFFSFESRAQCDYWGSTVAEVFVHDTTYEVLAVDTSLGVVPGAVFTWRFDDGTVYTGSVIRKPYTVSDYYYFSGYSLTCSACPDSTFGDVSCGFVFNCNHLQPYTWGSYWYSSPWFEQTDLHDPNTVSLTLGNYVSFFYTAPNHPTLMASVSLDWGNGRSFSTFWPIDTFYKVGGIDDTVRASHYQYSGEYRISGSYSYSFDTMTCPVLPIAPAIIYAAGPLSQPLISGATTYCAGDTLRLLASDTTYQFHNLFHAADTTGVGDNRWLPNDVWGNYWWWLYDWSFYYNYGSGYSPTSIYKYVWHDQYHNLLSADTTLNINNLSVFDSGTYILRVIEHLSGVDTEFTVHIAVNGSKITEDSTSNPVCGMGNGAIWLNCYRANDSVSVAYARYGVPQTFSGRTNSAGHLKIAGLSEGTYTNVRLLFAGDGCRSNTIPGPITLYSQPVDTARDTAFSVCAGNTVTLSAGISPAGASYAWAGPGGFTSTMEHPVITGITTGGQGVYTVTVDAGGCSVVTSAGVSITVLSGLPSLGPINFGDSVCARSTLSHGFIAGQAQITTSDTTVLRQLYGVSAGSATITYSLTNACGTSQYTQPVYVKPVPVFPSITGPDVVCIGDTATYHIAVTGGFWHSNNSGYYAMDTMTGFITGLAGNASTSVTYRKTTPDGCNIFQSKEINIGTPSGGYVFGNTGLYPGGSTTLTANIFGAGTTASWTSSASAVATVNGSGVVSAVGIGSAAITYTKTNSCGASWTVTKVYVGDWIDTKMAGSAGVVLTDIEHIPALSTSIACRITDIARDTIQNVYVLDNNGDILKVNKEGLISTVVGNQNTYHIDQASYPAYTGDGGLACFASLGAATHITCDKAGNLFVSCTTNGAIRKIDRNGIITCIAGMPQNEIYAPYNSMFTPYGYSGDGGAATAAKIYPGYVAADDAGNVYFTDWEHNRVRKISAAGIISTIAGNGTATNSGDGGPATNAAIKQPGGIAIDSAGNVIVSTDGYLRKIDNAGIISTIAGMAGSSSTGGEAATATAPIFVGQLRIDKYGSIFTNNGVINRIDRLGIVSQVAGGASNYYNTGIPTIYNGFSSAVNVGGGFDLDDSGGVYVGDLSSNTVRKEGKPSLKIHAADAVCHGPTAVTFTAQGHNTGRTPSYLWQKNGANVGTDNYVYTDAAYTAGDTISCKVYMTHGGVYLASAKKTVAIDENASAIGAIGASLCVADTITLTNTATGGIWSSGSTAVTIAGGTVTGVSAGGAIITYTLTNACGITTDTAIVTVNAMPDAGLITGSTVVCEAGTISLSGVTTGGTWSSSSVNATVVGGVVSGVSAGTTIISYSVANMCGADVDTMEITVNPLPEPINVSGATTACVGVNLTLSGGPLGATWTSSDGCATVAAGLVYGIYPGTTLITSSMANSCGIASDTMTIAVIALPGAGLTSGVNVICAGGATTLTNSGGMAGGTWSSSSSAATVAGGVVTGVSAGTAIISYSFTNYCGTATDTIEVTINGLPASGTITGADTVCEGNSVTLAESVVGGVWSILTTATGTITSTGIFTAVHEGDADVSYSVTNTCGTSVAYRTLHVISADDCGGSGERTAFNIYPDPNNGSFTIEVPQPGNNARITIMDVTGRTIQTITPLPGQLQVPVSLSNMPSGTYMVKLVADGRVYSGKVVLW